MGKAEARRRGGRLSGRGGELHSGVVQATEGVVQETTRGMRRGSLRAAPPKGLGRGPSWQFDSIRAGLAVACDMGTLLGLWLLVGLDEEWLSP